jgi:hypothetical protein
MGHQYLPSTLDRHIMPIVSHHDCRMAQLQSITAFNIRNIYHTANNIRPAIQRHFERNYNPWYYFTLNAAGKAATPGPITLEY